MEELFLFWEIEVNFYCKVGVYYFKKIFLWIKIIIFFELLLENLKIIIFYFKVDLDLCFMFVIILSYLFILFGLR